MVRIDTDTSKSQAVRLLVRGQLDLTAAGPLGEALRATARSGRTVELDLSHVDFIDGCGLSMLLNATRRSRRGGPQLTIVAVSGCVRRLIEMTETAERLPSLPAVGERAWAKANDELIAKALEGTSPSFRF
jgi:anti-anti-sigma factor